MGECITLLYPNVESLNFFCGRDVHHLLVKQLVDFTPFCYSISCSSGNHLETAVSSIIEVGEAQTLKSIILNRTAYFLSSSQTSHG